MIEIIKHENLYFGKEFAKSAATGKIAMLRIPAADESIGIFKRMHESFTEFLPLCKDTFPAGFYPPEKLFTNWQDFPELHAVKIMAWDLGNTPGVESQYVRDCIEEAIEATNAKN